MCIKVLHQTTRLILLLVPEEIILRRVVRPDVLDALVDFAVVLKFLEILNYFSPCSRTCSVVDKLFLLDYDFIKNEREIYAVEV